MKSEKIQRNYLNLGIVLHDCYCDFDDIATEQEYSRTILTISSPNIGNLSDYHQRSVLSKEISEQNSDAEYSMPYGFQEVMQIDNNFCDQLQGCFSDSINLKEIELGMNLWREN